jgi:hypothetical protein
MLGGGLQGSASGNFTRMNSNFSTNNFRWRYAKRNNDLISKVILGQTGSDGLDRRNFTGISVTNEPVEPRYIFDEYEIQGDAPPGSEVELYFNNALYDFQEITQNGQYRFLAPVSYGNSRLQLRIYDPAGGVREITRRIQVPFGYLPAGDFEYHLNAGRLNNTLLGSRETGNIAQGDMGYGLSKNLTQKIGFEYLSQAPDQTPLFYSSTSARLFNEHLLNFDAAPTAFYRVSANAIYASSTSWNLAYTNFKSDGIYNTSNNDHEINGNLYLPFNAFDYSSGFRISGLHNIRNALSSTTRYNIDLHTRIDRLNLRFRYSDTQRNEFSFNPSSSSEFRTSATYSVGQSANIHSFFDGTFLRAQVSYNPNSSKIVRAQTQIARSIFEDGRIQASFSRDFIADFSQVGLSLSIDLQNTRLSSTTRHSANSSSFTQNMTGSIGFDNNTDNIIYSNRQQVGRSATSVRLYVDKNNSGTFDSEDEIIKNNAVRISKSSISNMNSDGTIYLSQLQQYNQMNMEINKSNIQNPLLVPEFEKFSIVTDPNQYKPINIPFYVSGVISGQVNRVRGNNKEGVSGLRVYLSDKKGSVVKEMNTFSDGSYYAYEIPPGKYDLYIDEKQLTFLNATSEPDTMQIEVEPTAEGDFVEGLNFTLKTKQDTATKEKEVIAKEEKEETKENIATTDTSKTTTEPAKSYHYQIQLASFQTQQKSEKVAENAGKLFGQSFHVTKNTNTDLYAIRSAPIYGDENAFETLRIHHNSYPQAAIVIVDYNQNENSSSNFSNLILGCFNNSESANKFAFKATKELEGEIIVRNENDLYKVILTKKFPETQEKRELLANLLTNSPQRPMKFSFQIRLEDISGNEQNPDLKTLLDNNADIEIKYPEDNLMVFEDIPTWDKTKELIDELKNILEVGYPIVELHELLSAD